MDKLDHYRTCIQTLLEQHSQFNIKDGKIWLQQNTTDIDVGQELIDMGVPDGKPVLTLNIRLAAIDIRSADAYDLQ